MAEPVGCWLWDASTNAVVWSDELYRIVGVPVGSPVTADSHVAFVHPDDRERLSTVVSASLAAGQRCVIRWRLVRPDGSIREVELTSEPIVVDGMLVRLMGTTRDVTDALRREQTIRLFSDIIEGLAIGLSVWRRDAGELLLHASNQANEAMTGIRADQLGMPFAQCWPAAQASGLPGLLRATDSDHPRRELSVCRIASMPGAPVFTAKAFALPDDCIGLALEDVTQRIHDQRLHFAERGALQMMSTGSPLEDVLTTIAEIIEELVPEAMASVEIMDGQRLVLGAAPSLPEAFLRHIKEVQVGPNHGSSGTAAFRRDSVFVRDIETDPLWDADRLLARHAGLRACWSTPILANDGRVLGTFSLYFRTTRAPTHEIELLARVVHMAGLAIERRRLDDRLQALSSPTSVVSVRSERS